MAPFKYSITHYIYILLSLSALLSFASETNDQDSGFSYWRCKEGSTFTPNGTFEDNLKALLSYLASNSSTNDGGFYSTITGWGTADSITGQFLCRGDVNSTTCHDCVTLAASEVLQRCPNHTDAIIYYDFCMLRYTNQSFDFDTVVASALVNTNNASVSASEESRFNQSLGELLSDVAEKAANPPPPSNKKFATGEVEFTSTEKLYGLEQCTPDLTSSECGECLEKALEELWMCCEGILGARVMLTGCFLRYEVYSFYYAADDTPAPSSSGKRLTGAKKLSRLLSPIIVSVTLFCLGCFLLRRKTRKSNNKAILRENFGEEGSNLKSLRFNLATIEAATNKFSHENRIGKGGFGEVYKGIFSDGRQIAVKRLKKFWIRNIRI